METVLWIVIGLIVYVVVLNHFSKKVDKQNQTYHANGMKSDKVLTFELQKCPRSNPNPRNDFYKTEEETETPLAWFVLLVALCCVGLGVKVLSADNKAGFVLVGMGLYLGYFMAVEIYHKSFRYKRETIFSQGHAYPGVIIQSEAYLKYKRVYKRSYYEPEYAITIRYDGRTLTLYGFQITENPGVVLENPYCTVYEYGDKVIAADFKVKDCYIDKEGKFIGETYLWSQREALTKELEKNHAPKR